MNRYLFCYSPVGLGRRDKSRLYKNNETQLIIPHFGNQSYNFFTFAPLLSTISTMKKIFIFSTIIFISITITFYAQSFFTSKKYPKGSFASPVKIPLSLAGNFGECRPNHFHSGLDVRTNKVENIPIYAIGDGYVSRVKIDNGGFGNAIYITHTNGFTSLYAHLNLFWTSLENHIRFNQYKQKNWKIDMTFLPHEFPVRKGQFIANSGNTGSSQAPHLHMEIRDTKTDKPLNGLLFYNLPDTKAPLLKKLAVYDVNRSIYDQTPKQYVCTKNGATYKPGMDTIVVNSNHIALGIVADDPMENALGVLGAYEVNLYLDGAPHFGWQLDNIGYEETRYMNAQADYRVKKNGGSWIQLCFQQIGDKLNIYKNYNLQNGRINLSDGKKYSIKMIVKDVAGNSSELQFWIRSNLSSAYKRNYILKAMQENKFVDANISFTLPKEALYDDVPFSSSIKPSTTTYSHLYQVHFSDVPVHTYFDLHLKPKTAIPANLATKIAFVRYPYGKDTDKKGKAGKLDGTMAVASVRDFGTYEIVIDQTPPSLTCNIANNAKFVGNKIICTSKEETTSVEKFVGKIDGQWVRFVQKGNTFTYEKDKYCGVGNHQLEINSTDENGNTKIIKCAFVVQ
jgi:murein DD-endopeptidase MepM/ murein hydrolase activator NlpD